MGEYLLDPDQPAPDVPFEDMRIAMPVEASITAHWRSVGVERTFELEDVQEMSQEDFRLFVMCVLCGNVDDPRFIERFRPEVPDEAAEQPDEG